MKETVGGGRHSIVFKRMMEVPPVAEGGDQERLNRVALLGMYKGVAWRVFEAILENGGNCKVSISSNETSKFLEVIVSVMPVDVEPVKVSQIVPKLHHSGSSNSSSQPILPVSPAQSVV